MLETLVWLGGPPSNLHHLSPVSALPSLHENFFHVVQRHTRKRSKRGEMGE
jgi:hypothetical protein